MSYHKMTLSQNEKMKNAVNLCKYMVNSGKQSEVKEKRFFNCFQIL